MKPIHWNFLNELLTIIVKINICKIAKKKKQESELNLFVY